MQAFSSMLVIINFFHAYQKGNGHPIKTNKKYFTGESFEWFTEDQAFSQSYDLAPSPPHPPVSKLDRRHIGRLRKRDNLLTGEGGRGGGVAKSFAGPESLVLCKSFNTLPLLPFMKRRRSLLARTLKLMWEIKWRRPGIQSCGLQYIKRPEATL